MTTQTLTYRFTLDTFKNGIQRLLQGFQSGESVQRKMEITLSSGTDAFELPLDNISAQMYVKRPSQSSPSINACSIDSANNRILYTVNPNDLTEAGIVEMQLKIIETLSGSANVIISPKFAMEVWESNIQDSSAEGTTTYTSLTEALADAIGMKNSSIAEFYIDDDNILTVVFGDGTTYTSDVIKDAISRIDDVESYCERAESAALASEASASDSAASALASATSEANAATSEANASTSEANASASASAASTSATNAATSEANASTYASNASASASSASTSATNAATSESNASASASSASASASNASTSESNASTSASNASASASAASASATQAEAYETLAKSYCSGGTGERQGEETDNCAYYKQRCEEIAGGLEGGILPMGTVQFSALPTITSLMKGHMYNISDSFTSDSRFKDGGGKTYAAGTNVYVTADLMWDCFSGAVPSVNGKTGNAITLNGSDLLVSGYSKASSQSAITVLDSINSALGKLEKKVDDSLANDSSLDSRLTTAEGSITSILSRLTSIESRLTALEALPHYNMAMSGSTLNITTIQ